MLHSALECLLSKLLRDSEDPNDLDLKFPKTSLPGWTSLTQRRLKSPDRTERPLTKERERASRERDKCRNERGCANPVRPWRLATAALMRQAN
jgi:hypothetical protein